MDKKLFGTRLKELRKENRITQKELAQKLDTTDKTIWAYENGKATPPLEMLLSYANLFQCSLWCVFFYELQICFYKMQIIFCVKVDCFLVKNELFPFFLRNVNLIL